MNNTGLRPDKVVSVWHILLVWFAVAVLPVILILTFFYFQVPTCVKSNHSDFDRAQVIGMASTQSDDSPAFSLVLQNGDVFEVDAVGPILTSFDEADNEKTWDMWYTKNEENLEYKCTVTQFGFWRIRGDDYSRIIYPKSWLRSLV